MGLVERGEGTSQRAYMHDPRTWTVVWGLTVGIRGELGGGKQREKNWDNCNSINNKIFKREE